MRDLADGVIDLYERRALEWDADRRMAEWNDKPWLDRFVALLPEGGSVLDLGCGSGWPIARHLVECGFRITGVDSSPTLISLCRQRLSEQEWLIGDMRSLRLDRPFDGLLAWDSFFHLKRDDQRHMFKTFAEHGAASAVLMFNSGPQDGEAVGNYRGDPLYHASLGAANYTELLHNIGFAVVAHATEDWRTGGGRTVWLAKSRRSV
jgi:SAM-dependent methyltransferase